MAEVQGEEKKRTRAIKKYTFRGMDIEQLMKLPKEKLIEQFPARQRRRFARGLKHKYAHFMQKLSRSKKNL